MTIEAIFVASARGAPQLRAEAVRVVVGKGIQGDRNFGKGKYAGQNITFVEAEEIERFNAASGLAIDLAATRRNIVTRGVRLAQLVGKEFAIGEAQFRGIEICEPCARLASKLHTEKVSATKVVRLFAHRAGLRADVIATGTVRVGDQFLLKDHPSSAE
jgi:MOSC domain-containing protein YiiM